MLKEFIINDPKLAKIYLHPLRQNILKILKDLGKGSSTDISRILNLPAPNISYHMKLLEKSGLVVIVEEKKVKNLVEKIFEPVAQEIKMHVHDFESDNELERLLDATFSCIKSDFIKNPKDENPLAYDKGIEFHTVNIKEENLLDFIKDYKAFTEKYKMATEDSTPYKLGIIYIKDV